ncbi:uncharacterized protein LOC127019100 [Gymnogyps californianus]|uniref:uncharacterized protein LOC127019100 n=1 Tax=Gymnogyps californianus TaxID=33616 RepID=UPI0021CAD1E5|nr:uncharacterized protein LOC127019100 [Gymnogyps californianus]
MYSLESKNYLKANVGKKEPASLNSHTDKVCLSPSPQLLQQPVELLINLRAVPGPLRARQDPCKGQGMSWSEADEDLDLHSRKDVHEGTRFPLRSHQVTLTLLPSDVDVFQPVSVIQSSQHRAEENGDQAHPRKEWLVGIASVKQHAHRQADFKSTTNGHKLGRGLKAVAGGFCQAWGQEHCGFPGMSQANSRQQTPGAHRTDEDGSILPDVCKCSKVTVAHFTVTE